MTRSIIFDLDGTLIESLTSIVKAMNRLLREAGFPEHPFSSYRMFIGDGVEKLVERALPEIGPAKISQYMEEYIRLYVKIWREDTVPFDGIKEMLNSLRDRGIRLMILSNKRDDLTRLQVEELFQEIRFSEVRGARQGIPKKPDPAVALDMASRAGADPGNTLFIGDSGVDMKTALNAGMIPGGVLWGFRGKEELEANGAVHLFRHPSDITRSILS